MARTVLKQVHYSQLGHLNARLNQAAAQVSQRTGRPVRIEHTDRGADILAADQRDD